MSNSNKPIYPVKESHLFGALTIPVHVELKQTHILSEGEPSFWSLDYPRVNSSNSQTWVKSGYWYAGSEFPVPDINSPLFTHLICAFAFINSSTYELSISSSDEPYISTFTQIIKKKNPSLIPLLSVWAGDSNKPSFLSNSSTFFSMVNQSSYRKSFIQSSIKTAKLYGFQGLDLWAADFPNMNYTYMEILLDEWRAEINLESNESQFLLTMAGHYSPSLGSLSYPVESIKRNLDWVHIVSFDYHLPTRENLTGAHSALYDPMSRLNTDYGIKQWVRRGLPASKIVLGLAYHGYAWTLADPKDKGIRAPARGLAITEDGSMSYSYIKKYMRSYGAVLFYNETYVVNYCVIGLFWIGFDDVEAIRAKVAYAKEKGLLGYNVWQAPGDDNWVLSKAAVRRVMHPHKRPPSTYLQVFAFTDIKAATNNFSGRNKLGEGGYGPVYKGKLPNGQDVAVKRLSHYSKQGLEEFENEVTLTAKLQHVNLVRLLGFCTGREEKMLIYEYMPNKSLDFYLFDPARKSLLDWEKRVHIIEGLTQGLLYLQEYSRLTIIHRDLKGSNILLDGEMKPKISDFGIARSFKKDEHEANTGRIVGTYGYVPPEYVKQGMYSRKFDVYSFGVLLLQIISGKKTNCMYGSYKNLNLLDYAYELWKEGRGMEFMDPSLDDTFSTCKLIRCMKVALLCIQEKWTKRPSMLEIYSMLKNETEIVPNPERPAFSTKKEDAEESKSTSRGETCSVDVATISEVLPR
ncbi:hypothetical protein LguiA_011137 [Lonicera macranthoides]